ncbi:adenylate/guanylate cyclase domain-containing protein [Catenulispora pinisilvae]|uniref:adenylate/guanylate cyclase domain-containing protein n=1 Tax=Catenulispora pinisilvae TaxID=2705253 RepID=UPI001892804F|nr:adenylate/guanylate cyclase domain-containing protein [Catenulispora pinisilvae]
MVPGDGGRDAARNGGGIADSAPDAGAAESEQAAETAETAESTQSAPAAESAGTTGTTGTTASGASSGAGSARSGLPDVPDLPDVPTTAGEAAPSEDQAQAWAAAKRKANGDELEALLLGGVPRHTAYEVCKAAGIPYDEARRYWRAMGFADVGQARAFTDADVDALLRLGGMPRSGLFTEEFAIQVARSMGQTTARLAEWQVDALFDAFDTAGVGSAEMAEFGYRIGRRVLPELEELLVYVWRRQLAAAAGRVRQQLQEHAEGQQAVGFADLVSFTRLSRQLSEEELARLVSVFEATAADTVAFGGGRLIKTLGDEIMFAADSPARAARIALDLLASMRRTEAVPELRIGVAYGHVVQRNGDIYGTTVNLAARLTSLAEPDQIVVDPELAKALDPDAAFALAPIGTRMVRGLGEIEASALTPAE